MAKLPVNRYSSAAEMLEALDAYVQDPSVTFQYQYVKEEPEKVVNDPMPQKRSIRRPPERPAANPARPKAGAKKKKRSGFMPVLLGITTAFALACAALCWDHPERFQQHHDQKRRHRAGRFQRHDPGRGERL